MYCTGVKTHLYNNRQAILPVLPAIDKYQLRGRTADRTFQSRHRRQPGQE